MQLRSPAISALPLCLGAMGILFAACEERPTAPHAPSPDPGQSPGPIAQVIAAPAHGGCGGLAVLDLTAETPLLHDRVRLRLPSSAEIVPPPHDVMSAPPSEARTSSVRIVHASATLVVVATELQRSTRALAADVEQVVETGWTVESISPSVVLASPDRFLDERGSVTIARAFVADERGMVVRLDWVTQPTTASRGGCTALARRMAETLRTGTRQLESLDPGLHTLFGTVSIDLPPGYSIWITDGPDFGVYHVDPPLPLVGADAWLGIYAGGFPDLEHPPGARKHRAVVLDEAVTLFGWEQDGVLRREAWLEEEGLHLFLGASDPARLAELEGVLATLARRPPLDRTPRCEETASPAAPRSEIALDADARALSSATEIALYQPTSPASSAFQRVLARPDASGVLETLATGRSLIGRVYGLAGLAAIDRAGLARAWCHRGAALEGEVDVVDACGRRAVLASELIRSPAPDAIRGEPYWSASEWSSVRSGTPDAIGGGLARAIALAPRDYHELLARHLRARLAPATAPARDAVEVPIAPERRGAAGPVSVSATEVCARRRDGSIACAGETSSRPIHGIVPFSPSITLGTRTCSLDGAGRRWCTDLITATERAHAGCAPHGLPDLVHRAFDDGPWRELASRPAPYGLDQHGALVPLDRELHDLAADLEGSAARRIPLPAPVRGMRFVAPHLVVWSDDRRVWRIGRDGRVEAAGALPPGTELAGGFAEGLFARDRDGRILGSGLASRWWTGESDERADRPWRELAELRGATRIESAHTRGCALVAEARVLCWGIDHHAQDGERAREVPSPAHELTPLRGALDLFVHDRLTCGVMSPERIRCLGEDAPRGVVGAQEIAPGVVEVPVPL